VLTKAHKGKDGRTVTSHHVFDIQNSNFSRDDLDQIAIQVGLAKDVSDCKSKYRIKDDLHKALLKRTVTDLATRIRKVYGPASAFNDTVLLGVMQNLKTTNEGKADTRTSFTPHTLSLYEDFVSFFDKQLQLTQASQEQLQESANAEAISTLTDFINKEIEAGRDPFEVDPSNESDARQTSNREAQKASAGGRGGRAPQPPPPPPRANPSLLTPSTTSSGTSTSTSSTFTTPPSAAPAYLQALTNSLGGTFRPNWEPEPVQGLLPLSHPFPSLPNPTSQPSAAALPSRKLPPPPPHRQNEQDMKREHDLTIRELMQKEFEMNSLDKIYEGNQQWQQQCAKERMALETEREEWEQQCKEKEMRMEEQYQNNKSALLYLRDNSRKEAEEALKRAEEISNTSNSQTRSSNNNDQFFHMFERFETMEAQNLTLATRFRELLDEQKADFSLKLAELEKRAPQAAASYTNTPFHTPFAYGQVPQPNTPNTHQPSLLTSRGYTNASTTFTLPINPFKPTLELDARGNIRWCILRKHLVAFKHHISKGHGNAHINISNTIGPDLLNCLIAKRLFNREVDEHNIVSVVTDEDMTKALYQISVPSAYNLESEMTDICNDFRDSWPSKASNFHPGNVSHTFEMLFCLFKFFKEFNKYMEPYKQKVEMHKRLIIGLDKVRQPTAKTLLVESCPNEVATILFLLLDADPNVKTVSDLANSLERKIEIVSSLYEQNGPKTNASQAEQASVIASFLRASKELEDSKSGSRALYDATSAQKAFPSTPSSLLQKASPSTPSSQLLQKASSTIPSRTQLSACDAHQATLSDEDHATQLLHSGKASHDHMEEQEHEHEHEHGLENEHEDAEDQPDEQYFLTLELTALSTNAQLAVEAGRKGDTRPLSRLPLAEKQILPCFAKAKSGTCLKPDCQYNHGHESIQKFKLGQLAEAAVNMGLDTHTMSVSSITPSDRPLFEELCSKARARWEKGREESKKQQSSSTRTSPPFSSLKK